MDAIFQTLRNLGPTRLAVMGMVVFGLIAFFIYMTARLGTPQMAMLYGDLEQADSTKIAQSLQAQNIPHEIRAGGREVYVPSDKVAPLRMTMADQGLPNGGTIGYELFDSSESIGTTNFQQNVNLVRALEGELARSIGSIENVRSARVHLVLPQRELFSRERQEASASVVLKMRGKLRLNQEKVQAIQHLVASAIPGLQPNRISVIDDKGALLAGGFEEDSAAAGPVSAKVEERRRSYENRMARTIENLLEKTVGFGNVRAEVTADIDFDRVTTNEEVYDPESQVVRSSQTIEQTSSSKENQGTAPVSVTTNLPDANLASGESATNTEAESRVEETTNYEISKKMVSHTREAGVVKRLSVAVLLNHKTTWADGADKPLTEAWPDDQMERFGALVRSAIGYDIDRGDSVEVIQMEFAEIAPPKEEQIELFLGFDKDDVLRMAEVLVLAIVGILVILLVLRPLVTRAMESMPTTVPEGGLLAEGVGAPALTGPGGMPVPMEGMEEEEQFDELIDIDRVEGRVKASSVKKVGEIVEKHPEEALSIVRNWMYQEG